MKYFLRCFLCLFLTTPAFAIHTVDLIFHNDGSCYLYIDGFNENQTGIGSPSVYGNLHCIAPGDSLSFVTDNWGVHGNDGASNIWYFAFQGTMAPPNNCSQTGPVYYSYAPKDVNGAGTTFTYDFHCWAPSCAPACWTNYVWHVVNQDVYGHTYGLSDGSHDTDGSLIVGFGISGGGATTAYLRPGESADLTARLACSATNNFDVYMLTGSSSLAMSGTNSWQDWGSASKMGLPSTGGSVNQSADQNSSGSVYNASDTNASPILWQSAAYSDTATAVRNAASAAYDQTAKAINQAHDDALNLLAAVKSLPTNNPSANGETNVFVFNYTNDPSVPYLGANSNIMVVGFGNLTNQANQLHSDLTNLTGRMATNFDPVADSALKALTNLLGAVGDTNADIATESTFAGYIQPAVVIVLDQCGGHEWSE